MRSQLQHQTTSRLILTFTTLLTIAVTACPRSASAKEAAPANPYPQEAVQIFVNSCVSGGKGIDPVLMKNICSCSINGIQNQYTLAEFVKISDETKKSNSLPPKLTQIVQSCAEQALQ
ncbi:MAG: hypothetical protein HC780_07705 [Leptolyngbyaceae cyanobacterium CSU_1_3]|nr:hypothetical protein [Leptolyngbyaceae cyanobacterium CSU_1_3]